jgi:hypothetical protein
LGLPSPSSGLLVEKSLYFLYALKCLLLDPHSFSGGRSFLPLLVVANWFGFWLSNDRFLEQRRLRLRLWHGLRRWPSSSVFRALLCRPRKSPAVLHLGRAVCAPRACFRPSAMRLWDNRQEQANEQARTADQRRTSPKRPDSAIQPGLLPFRRECASHPDQVHSAPLYANVTYY